MTSLTFAQDITAELAQQNLGIDPEEVSESLTASTYYRAVTIEAKGESPEIVVKLLNTAIKVFQRNGLKYWDRVPGGIEGNGIKVVVLNPASKAKLVRSKTKIALDLVLRTGLALTAALGLAFLAHYLDDSLRDPLQTEEYLGLPLLGIIPQE
jgi:capsular polysaccharide biosynthesis protein